MNEALETYFGIPISQLLEELDYLSTEESYFLDDFEEEMEWTTT